VTFSPFISGLQGNYRLYAWGATYAHDDLTSLNTTHRGWGIGVSLDQMVTPSIGLFARAAYQNKDVYAVDWFWSLGANFKGLIPTRSEDELGIGVAALLANDDLDESVADTGYLLSGNNEDTEWHLEAYYRIVLSKFFAISPDIQYVINPLGDTDNDNILTGMIRGEFNF
jgi:carbohydrate-selective porin OprB